MITRILRHPLVANMRPPMTRIAPALRGGATLLLALVLLCACERSDGRYFGTTKPRHGPDEAWTNLGSEPEWIDPGKTSDSAGGAVAFNLFAGLTQAHPKTLEPMPDVARNWDVSSDGLVYTFHLRTTQWSDG